MPRTRYAANASRCHGHARAPHRAGASGEDQARRRGEPEHRHARRVAPDPGVGPARVRNILAYRRAHPFRTVDELARIKGIGRKTIRHWRMHLAVGGPFDGPTGLASRCARGRAAATARAVACRAQSTIPAPAANATRRVHSARRCVGANPRTPFPSAARAMAVCRRPRSLQGLDARTCRSLAAVVVRGA
jgi:hypothetical protein